MELMVVFQFKWNSIKSSRNTLNLAVETLIAPFNTFSKKGCFYAYLWCSGYFKISLWCVLKIQQLNFNDAYLSSGCSQIQLESAAFYNLAEKKGLKSLD